VEITYVSPELDKTNNFETSLENSILLNSSNVADDEPVAVFCNQTAPTLDVFELIKDADKAKAFRDFLSNAPEDDYLTHLVFTILKLSSISDRSKEALSLAQHLFKDAFEYAKDKDRVSCFFCRCSSLRMIINPSSLLLTGQERPKLFPHSAGIAEIRRETIQAKVQRSIMS